MEPAGGPAGGSDPGGARWFGGDVGWFLPWRESWRGPYLPEAVSFGTFGNERVWKGEITYKGPVRLRGSWRAR